MRIREAILEDARAISKVHVDTWRSAYKDIISKEYLLSLNYNSKETLWRKNILQNKGEEYIFIAETQNSDIVGFACCGKEREGNFKYQGELYAIYVLESYQNKGIGKALFQKAVEKLKSLNSMLVWVLQENKYSIFYKSMGGKIVSSRTVSIGGKDLKELAYGWDDLEKDFLYQNINKTTIDI